MTSERQARMGLAASVEPGCAALADLVAVHGAVAVWETLRHGEGRPGWVARAQTLDLDDLQRRSDLVGGRFLVPGDPEWPVSVDDLARVSGRDGVGGPPLGLWVRGAPLEGRPRVAVVGSRACTAYGSEVARDLGYELAQQGIDVVSGGAFGIDAAAHRGALAASGRTMALLACGVDEDYPARHSSLFRAICDQGCLVSEHPPGAHPTRARFLARNRLVAALAQGTVVVQAAARSGSRSTASWATRLSRVVMAVPGPVTCSQSVTPHRLIRDQEAVLVSSAAEVVAAVAPVGQALLREAEGERRVLDGLSAEGRAVLDAIPARGSASVDVLARMSELSARVVLAAVQELEDEGLVELRADGGWGIGRRRADAIVRREVAAHVERLGDLL